MPGLRLQVSSCKPPSSESFGRQPLTCMSLSTRDDRRVTPQTCQTGTVIQQIPIQQVTKLDQGVARDLELSYVSRPLPDVYSRVHGTVKSYDWSKDEDRDEACKLLETHAAGDPSGPQAPILIKGAISDWPALSLWTLDFLAKNYGRQRVAVRVSPSMQFPYCEPRWLLWWRRFHRGKSPPTELLHMSLAEFADRMQDGCPLPPLVYPKEEFYYMQSMFAAPMFQHIDIRAPPMSCLGQPGLPGSDNAPSGLVVAQVPRIWLSPSGAVSPLHFDTASSFLMQIRGRKRLIFWPPKDLKAFKPYPDWHILRRRARVKPTDADFPAELIGIEAVLEPGDVLWFPGYWSHYTESRELSLSMTYRFRALPLQPAKRSWLGFGCLRGLNKNLHVV